MTEVELVFKYSGQEITVKAGEPLPFVVPGMRELVADWVKKKEVLRRKTAKLHMGLAKVQPLHWEAEIAKAAEGLSSSETLLMLRNMLQSETMDKWEGSFTLDEEAGVIRFVPGSRASR